MFLRIKARSVVPLSFLQPACSILGLLPTPFPILSITILPSIFPTIYNNVMPLEFLQSFRLSSVGSFKINNFFQASKITSILHTFDSSSCIFFAANAKFFFSNSAVMLTISGTFQLFNFLTTPSTTTSGKSNHCHP